MIITKIELENFMCYELNSIEFTEGLNVIIGDNGYGKSKLYDAFYWVLYDQVFIPEKKNFQKTKYIEDSSIVSDKAKADLSRDSIIVSVKITFDDRDNNRGNIYSIERRYVVRRKHDKWTPDKESEQIISKKEIPYLHSQIIDDKNEQERILKKILPDNIKPYMWFQGEQVESIIDFNKQDTLTNAINVLSNINRFDEIVEVAKMALASGKSEYDREAKKLSKDKNKSDELEKEKNKQLQILDELKREEALCKDNIGNAEEKSSSLLNKIDDAEAINKLELKKNHIHRYMDDLKKEIEKDEIAFHKKIFNNYWVLKGTEHLIEQYEKVFSNYENAKMQKEAFARVQKQAVEEIENSFKRRLPIDVPEPIYVKSMLENERCLVCDREALKDSEPWLKIKELLTPKFTELKEEKPPYKTHDFHGEFKKLYQNSLALGHRIKDIDENIRESMAVLEQKRLKLKAQRDEAENLEQNILKILENVALERGQINNVLSEYTHQKNAETKFKIELSKIANQIMVVSGKIDKITLELRDLTKGDLPLWLSEKIEILTDFESVAISTRERVFSELIEKLEQEANMHYQAMTADNKSIRGLIKLQRLTNGNYMPQLIDDEGNTLLLLNTSNIILIKLATIMAIISAKQGTRTTELYTLITDAPMSVFGENYTIGFCKRVSQVYKQSIIMSKEFYKNIDLRKQLLQSTDEIRLGKVYLLTPSVVERDRTNRNTLTTQITPLN